MRFQPKSQEEIDAENLCAEGDFPFTIAEASEQFSAKGKPMFKLKLFIHGDNERDWHVYDYVSPAFMAHRLLHLAECTGLFPEYSRGELESPQLVGRTGHCAVSVQEAKGGYPAKNIIEDYIVPDRKKAMADNKAASTPPPASPDVDDIPF